MSSRYSSFRDSKSSALSTPTSSSTELKPKNMASSSSAFKRLMGNSKSQRKPHEAAPIPESLSRAIVKTKSNNNEQSLSAVVKKFMEKKPKGASRGGLVVAAEILAEDLRKNGKKKGGSFGGLGKKLFSSGKGGGDVKALTEVKGNTRTLAMVLRSERELLGQNKDLGVEITDLKLTIEEKNREVEKLKDLCLKQREEIKALKSAILFPDVMNTQLQELLEKQGSELNQAKQLIPNLQKQVTSLTGQLQFLADDLKEVKADKYSIRGCYDGHFSSPKTPKDDQEEAANSLEFSSSLGHTTPGSPDDMFVKDLNPCLTPYYATKSKEFEGMSYDSPNDDRLSEISMQSCDDDVAFRTYGKKLSKSSDNCQCSNSRNKLSRGIRRSDESKVPHGKQMQHKLF